jgi:5-oxoprolinase (ATP-hydrolysing)
MNNFTFGDATMGYYETIAGGAGAGPNWAGRSGVHTHMTNTRITGMVKQLMVVVLLLLLAALAGCWGDGQPGWAGGAPGRWGDGEGVK